MSRALFFMSGFSASGALMVAGLPVVGIGDSARAAALVATTFVIGILANAYYRKERDQ